MVVEVAYPTIPPPYKPYRAHTQYPGLQSSDSKPWLKLTFEIVDCSAYPTIPPTYSQPLIFELVTFKLLIVDELAYPMIPTYCSSSTTCP